MPVSSNLYEAEVFWTEFRRCALFLGILNALCLWDSGPWWWLSAAALVGAASWAAGWSKVADERMHAPY